MKRNQSADERGVRFATSVDCASPEALERSHCHDDYELLFVLDGEGKFVVEGKEYTLSARSIMITRPLEYHYVVINPEVRYERYVIRFSDSDLIGDSARVLEEILTREGDARSFCFSGMVGDAIVSVCERSQVAASMSNENSVAYTRMLLSELIFLFSLADTERAVSYDGDISVRVIKYLNEHINKNVSLNFLSNRFFVSKYYLCRVFKKHNGISIHSYIVQKRVLQAKLLIEAGESASTAAYKVGFKDYSAFYRAFIRIVGVPPTGSSLYKGDVRNEL